MSIVFTQKSLSIGENDNNYLGTSSMYSNLSMDIETKVVQHVPMIKFDNLTT